MVGEEAERSNMCRKAEKLGGFAFVPLLSWRRLDERCQVRALNLYQSGRTCVLYWETNGEIKVSDGDGLEGRASLCSRLEVEDASGEARLLTNQRRGIGKVDYHFTCQPQPIRQSVL